MKRLFEFVKRYTPWLAASLLLSGCSVLLSLLVPVLIGKALDGVIARGNVSFSLLRYVGIGLICAGLSGALQWLTSGINNRVTYSVARDMRQRAEEKLQRLPIGYYDTHSSGETVSRIINDTEALSDGLLLGFTQLFTGVFSVVATLVFMLRLNWYIALLVALLTPISMLVSSFIAKKTYRFSRLQSVTKGEQTAFIDETVTSLKTVKALGNEKSRLCEFERINARMEKHGLSATFFSSLTNPSTRFINSVIYASVALLGGINAYSGLLTVGGLACLLSYVNQYTKPFNEISGVIAEMQNALACAGRVFELLDTEEMTENDENEIRPRGRVEIKDLSFSYNKDKPLIRNFSLAVPEGSRVAIVGKTGCGKTTLINLLMRFYDADGGDILLDGKSIYGFSRKGLRKCFGMVLQETWLKSGTVAENIAFGRPDATIDEIIDAAKRANAHSFINKMENGYDTLIGDEGEGLSAGQKQLICIARVMLLSPQILILDEATSSIDTLTEQKVQAAFLKLLEGRTSFIVAHRLSTVKNADIIIVMDKGQIVERGTHRELISKKGFYYDLYNSRIKETGQ